MPTLHFVAQVPPQSMSVSEPETTPSEHGVALHLPPLQLVPLLQSELTLHFFSGAQVWQAPPPQSTSVSAASRVPFMQSGVQ